MSQVSQNRELILTFWRSWQGASPNWEQMHGCLAASVTFGEHAMTAEQFTAMCKQGNPWQDVELLSSRFTDEGGALLYEGTDTKTGKRVRVAEFIDVADGKVTGANACFGSGTPPA